MVQFWHSSSPTNPESWIRVTQQVLFYKIILKKKKERKGKKRREEQENAKSKSCIFEEVLNSSSNFMYCPFELTLVIIFLLFYIGRGRGLCGHCPISKVNIMNAPLVN